MHRSLFRSRNISLSYMFSGLARLIRSVGKSGRLLILDERSKDVIVESNDIWEIEFESRGNLFLRRN